MSTLYIARRGFREDNRVMVIRARSDGGSALYALPLRLDLANHSPDGFAWGYSGSGPAQLALALLADYYAHAGVIDSTLGHYQAFKAEVIAPLAQDEGWRLSDEQITDWLRRKWREYRTQKWPAKLV